MFLKTIIPFVFMLRCAYSNYDDYDQNLISTSESDLETCNMEEETFSCFCYRKQENGFDFKTCPIQPNPGKNYSGVRFKCNTYYISPM